MSEVAAIDLEIIQALTGGKFGRHDVPCPLCGPGRRSNLNRQRQVLRVWRPEPGFASFHCARCGERGYARDGSVARLDQSVIVRIQAEAAERERASALDRRSKAMWLWSKRSPITGTAADTYLRTARGYEGPFPSTLGYLPPRGKHGPAMIAAFGLPDEPEPGVLVLNPGAAQGVHITRLSADGLGKAGTNADKIMIGLSAGFPIVLAPANDLLGVAISEGIEDGLSLFAASGLGIWVAGSASRMPALAASLPAYVEFVNVAEDDDDAGQQHTRELVARTSERGFPTSLVVLGASQ
jgi:Toprim domain